MAEKELTWFKPFGTVGSGAFLDGSIHWFEGGKLNACYNAVDRHAASDPDRVAIIHEGDEQGVSQKVTYRELLGRVCQFANLLKEYGVRKGDVVAIYMPMMVDLAVAMLACARLGAPHSVVFAGFSAEALRDRILDAKCKWVITADQGLRGGKVIPLKKITDEAVNQCTCVEHVFVFQRTSADITYYPRDVKMNENLKRFRPYCPCEVMDSEDTLFLLYTSGSTGKPKGVLHTTAGYCLYAGLTQKYVFDYRPGDVFGCVADCGWITGHSYIVYGPLLNGATTLMFESTPMYPNPSRYWDLVDRHKVTQFYTAPTAIRALMRYGDEPVAKYDLSSLRVLGTVGEPINPEAWRWYFEVVGRKRCAIVDTYWQTET
ncbi:facA [Symbiodinium sp. KB8]|nr:facA [Symbiodinium sp. KB8]